MTPAGSRGRRLVVAVAAAAGIALTLRLGVWQLDRASQKEGLQAAWQAAEALPPLVREDLPADAEAAMRQRYRPVTLRGRWMTDGTVFLDNRPMDGRAGFVVLTPLWLVTGSDAILVQRGWVPRDAQQRTRLPELQTTDGDTEVAGLIAPAPSRLFEFEQGGTGPIRQNLSLDAFAAELRIRLRPYTVLQVDSPSTAGDGLNRNWPRPGVDVHKNYGYAVQWFSLAALITILYVWFQLIRPWRRGRA